MVKGKIYKEKVTGICKSCGRTLYAHSSIDREECGTCARERAGPKRVAGYCKPKWMGYE